MSDSDLFPFQDLRERDLRREGLLVGEGRLVCGRLISSGLDLISVVCTPRFAEEIEEQVGARCPLIIRSEEELHRIAGFKFHRGVLAAAKRPELAELGEQSPERSPLVVCAGIATSENLGSISRTAAAFGIDELVLDSPCCDPYSRRVLKVSVGALLTQRIFRGGEASKVAGMLHRSGYSVVGAAIGHGSVPVREFRIAGKTAFVFGSEAYGLGDSWLSECDSLVTIPMDEKVDSLNVGVAAGIILYDAFQRIDRD